MAASAAGSFRRERETGVLELLLVSPMPARAIVWGRLRGLYQQFLPTVVLLMAGWLFLMSFPGAVWRNAALVSFLVAVVAVPCIGLYFSLRARSFLGALAGTLSVAFLGPAVFGALLGFPYFVSGASRATGGTWLLAFLGCAAWWELVRRLERRQFQFNRELT
jgi:ABC-type transport system involved in cytochrome c biogenesis permease component